MNILRRLGDLLSLAQSDLGATPARSLIAVMGIALGVSVLLVVAGLGLGTRDVVLRQVVQALPLDMIEVVPRTFDLGLFKTDALFGGQALDSAMLARLEALDEVAKAYPKLEIRLPLGARGGARLFGRGLYTDLFAEGLPEELVTPEAPAFTETAGDPVIPVVISEQLLEIYNRSVAPTLGSPKLTADALTGFEFEIVVGRSLMLGSRGAAREGVERGRIAGVSRHALRLGVSMPLATGRRLLAAYGAEGPERYRSILLRAKSPKDVPAIAAKVRAMGLDIDESARRTADLLNAATALASLVGLLVLCLAGLNIAHSFFASLSERRRELAILRALGAGTFDLLGLVLAQALLLGALGGACGVVLAWLLAAAVDHSAAVFLPDFPFKPESFFVMPWWLCGAAFVAALAAACLGALWPAWRAARVPVAQALA
jgi:ABC-type antimicrobial peptide transport system permease subunit